MKLVWHIAQKDLRRMALPVAVWLVFIVAADIWFRTSAWTGIVVTAADVGPWRDSVKITAEMAMWLRFALGYVLVGAMVLEDPLTGSTAWWQTRPLTNTRLAVGKLVAALLLFVAAPSVALVPFWLGCGFSAREMGLAALDFAIGQTAIVTLAFCAAGLVRNLAQFLFCSVALAVAFLLCSVAVFKWTDVSIAILRSRNFIVQIAFVPTAALIAAHQFLTRRTARTWCLIAIALAASVGMRNLWPSDTLGVLQRYARAAEQPGDRALEVRVEQASAAGSEPWPLRLDLTTKAGSSLLYVPLSASGSAHGANRSPVGIEFKLANLRDADAAQLSLARPIGIAHWRLMGRYDEVNTPPAEPSRGQLELALQVARIRSCDALPEPPSYSTDGASRTRIAGVEDHADGQRSVLIEERGALGEWFLASGRPIGRDRRIPTGSRYRDFFALVNPVTHEARPLACEELGAVELDSHLVGFRHVQVPADAREGTWRQAPLVKVRLEFLREIRRTIEVDTPPAQLSVP